MTSITTFGYGLTVRATDLISASLAWPSLERTFHFFDLLLLRKRNRSLRVRTRDEGKENRIERVPVEVWEEVKDWVVLVEMESAEDAFLRPFLDREECDCGCTHKCSDRMSWEVVRHDSECCHTLASLLEYNEAFRNALSHLLEGSASQYRLVNRLVAAFGLAHPLPSPLTLDTQDWYSAEAVTLLTIPSRISDTSHSTISAEAGNGDRDEHTLVDVSLDLPDDADLRFKRFIRTFRLQVVQVTNNTLASSAPTPGAPYGIRTGFAGIKRDKVELVKEIKPSWKLYTTCWA